MPDAMLPFGRLGKPDLMQDAAVRVDFESDRFSQSIANHGYRMAWTRRAECPCAPADYQITAPDLGCLRCSGTGYLYFGDSTPQDLSTQVFTDVQQAAIDASGGFVIYGLMTGLSSQDKRNDRLGSWMMGSSIITVMAENRLGFRDRLINLDALYPYTEVTVMPSSPDAPLPLRYLVSGGVYLCQDTTGKRYEMGLDYLVAVGRLSFLPGRSPPAGTRVSVFFLTFPVMLVEDFSHRERLQNSLDLNGVAVSPEGRIQRLPLQARVSLEFIPSSINDGGSA